MKTQEANKIISEYMHPEFKKMKFIPLSYIKCEYYTSSLDALVPVWKKMCNFRESYRLTVFKDKCIADYSNENGMGNLQEAETIQEAAAIATAKAIQEQEK